jgi:hypothetical protein
MLRRRLLLVLGLYFVIIAVFLIFRPETIPIGPFTEDAVECTLRLEQDGDKTWAVLAVRNCKNHYVPICRSSLPKGDFVFQNPFHIEKEGNEVQYRGGWVNCSLPLRDDDYYWLRPWSTIETRVWLNKNYAIDSPGTYRIRFETVSPRSPEDLRRLEEEYHIDEAALPEGVMIPNLDKLTAVPIRSNSVMLVVPHRNGPN